MVQVVTATSSWPILRISRQERDFSVFTLWALVTFVQFPGDELLLYPLALYYAYAIWRDQKQVLPLMARCWIILLFPIWCLVSPLWAVDPTSATKHACYLFLTIGICFHVAATLTPRQVMQAIFAAASMIGIIHVFVAVLITQDNLGIFPSKNTLGKNMVILWAVAFAVLLDSGSHRYLRTAGFGVSALAAWLALTSNSVTAVLLVATSSLILIGGAVILRGGMLRASRLSILFALLGSAILIASVTLPFQPTNPVDMVLSHFGKDSTLTGRTVLWEYAEDQIRERPFLGVGAGGFWRYHESPLIQRIFFEFSKGPWDVFNFHNSYYEISVHQGLIGLGLVIAPLVWGIFIIGRWALTDGTIPAVYVFAHMLIVLARTFTEADFLRPFVLFHMIFWIGVFAAVRERMLK